MDNEGLFIIWERAEEMEKEIFFAKVNSRIISLYKQEEVQKRLFVDHYNGGEFKQIQIKEWIKVTQTMNPDNVNDKTPLGIEPIYDIDVFVWANEIKTMSYDFEKEELSINLKRGGYIEFKKTDIWRMKVVI